MKIVDADALLDRARRKRSYVLGSFGRGRLGGCGPDDVKRVLVIDSASRSGSSYLYYLLSRHPNVVSLNGESSVFEKLHGIGLVRAPEDCDAVDPDGPPAETLSRVAADILSDSGVQRQGRPEGQVREAFLADCVLRLILQHPEADLDPDWLHAAAAASLESGDEFSPERFWSRLLGAAAQRWPLDAARYDLSGVPALAEAGPPAPSFVLEEPPFVVPRPRVLPAPRELAGKTLLLKSSADCYRMALVKRLFARARVRFVVLARNPAAAISALADGWLSSGFFSHNLRGVARLEISGYSRDDRPWSGNWWKFDLPPGWHELRGRSLEEVCAFQWRSANERILRDVADKVVEEPLFERYEALLDPVSRSKALARIAAFAGLTGDFPSGGEAAAVMAVTAPAAGKWRKREGALAGVVGEASTRRLARELGYDAGSWREWP